MIAILPNFTQKQAHTYTRMHTEQLPVKEQVVMAYALKLAAKC